MFKIVTDYPLWLSIICLMLGFMYSWLLYGKQSKGNEMALWLKRTLFATRFIVVSLLAFFLLSPLIKTSVRTVEKPVVVIAQDNSSSILLNKDSAFYRTNYLEKLNQLADDLKDKYEVRTYTFGSQVLENGKQDFGEKQTDIQSLFDEIETRYVNRNLGAVIIATDGIYNIGESPLYSGANLKSPVYTIAMGDTMVQKDLILKKVSHNKTAFLGNTFPLEVLIEAKQLKGNMAELTIKKDSNTIVTQTINISNNSFTYNLPLQVKAETKGVLHYVIQLKPIAGEFTLSNNTTHVFVEVLDTRQKILLLADAPHPDIAALRQCLEKSEGYETDYFLAEDFNKSIEAYNLVILHQIPSLNNTNSKLLNDLQKSTVSKLFILGNNSNLNTFSTIQQAVKITNARTNFKDCLPEINTAFTFFNLSENVKNISRNFPPLSVPFGNTNVSAGAQPLFKQRVGSVVTSEQLFFFSELNETKTGIIMGEGLWKWKISNYQQQNNEEAFDEIINKTVQYLAVKSDKSLFKVNTKNSVLENEEILFDGQLLNESYEPITEPDIKMTISGEGNKKYSYVFTKNNLNYQLNAGKLPVGKYTYDGVVKSGDKTYTQRGSFSVNAIHIETINTTANHQLLYSLSQKTGATMVFPNQLESLKNLLNSKEEITAVSYTEHRLQELINIKWLFYILLILLTIEWFVRKRNGGY